MTHDVPKALDERTEQVVDLVRQNALMRNEHLFTHPTYGRVRVQRPTPRQEMDIAEARRSQYHKDIRDETILSRSELEREAIRRGIWSAEASKKADVLQTRIGQIMGLLDTVGYQSVDGVIQKFADAVERLRSLFPAEDLDVQNAISRYYNIDGTPDAADHRLIFGAATTTEVDDAMNEASLLRTQIELLHELTTARNELQPLILDQTRLFKDSIEARQDRVEEFAKIYHCTSREDGSKIWPSLEAMYDESPTDLELLMEEMWFFERGITEEYRTILSRHGFTRRAATESSSDDLPAALTSNSSGESQQNEQTSSGDSTE